jgi:hypothetical protein
MSQESYDTFGRPGRVTFARVLTAALSVATLAAASPIIAAAGFGKAPKLGEKLHPSPCWILTASAFREAC